LPGHKFGTTAVGWSPDGCHFASAGQDGKIKLWDLIHARERLALDGGAAWVESIAWNQGNGNGAVLATAAGRKLRLWGRDGRLLHQYPDHPSTITDAKWLPASNSSLLASAAYGQLALWDAKSGKAVKTFEWKGSILAIAVSPNGRFLATGNQDCTVHFWFAESGEDLQMSGYPTKVRELAWDFTSRYLATGGGDRITVWDCAGKGPAGSKPIVLKGHQGVLHGLAFQPNGALLASGADDGVLAVWHPTKKNNPIAVHVFNDAVTQLAWSPDSRWVAAGSHAGELKVIEVVQVGA
jgi:WD40 repeat protein